MTGGMDADSGDLTPAQAANELAALAVDRQRLAERFHTPWLLRCAKAVLPACWLIYFAVPDIHGSTIGYRYIVILALVNALSCLVSRVADRSIGIRSKAMSPGGTVAVVIYAIAFGLVLVTTLDSAASQLWLIGLLCAVAFVWTLVMTAIGDMSTSRRILRV